MTRVDTIYRRVNDTFLDPEVFNKDSLLGTPGLFRAWRKGNVGLANAPGAGVADDKVVYSYVPDVIRYFLDEDPILPNVPTFRASESKAAVAHSREHARDGRQTGQRIRRLRHAGWPGVEQARNREVPRAGEGESPQLCRATSPVAVDGAIRVRESVEPRHVDLRPFVLQGAKQSVTDGGLTRVALRKGSLVVNSSQGGGSKDTWIVGGDR